MNSSYDLIVLGAGSGGLAAAKRTASYGARVAIVEGDRVGGTCVIRGCVPKKLLVYGSAYKHLLADAASYGWEIEGIRRNPSTLLANVRAEVDRLNQLHLGFLEKAGVELVRGWGCFEDDHTVAVGERRLRAERILMPLSFSASCTAVRHSSSKPRSTRSRRNTRSTWLPSPLKMPANSTAM